LLQEHFGVAHPALGPAGHFQEHLLVYLGLRRGNLGYLAEPFSNIPGGNISEIKSLAA